MRSRIVQLLCEKCGGPLPPEAADRTVTCPYCGVAAAPAPRVVERVVERAVVVASATASGLVCPRCAEALRDARAKDALLRICRNCGGAWLDVATVDRLTKRTDEDLLQVARRALGPFAARDRNERPLISCPICAVALRRSTVGDTLDVDSCAEHGTWFDRGELVKFATMHAELRAGEIDGDDLAAAGLGRRWPF